MVALPVGRIWGRNLGHGDAAKNYCGSKLWSAAKSIMCISEGKKKKSYYYKFLRKTQLKNRKEKFFLWTTRC